MTYDLVISDHIGEKSGMRYFHDAYIRSMKEAQTSLSIGVASNYHDVHTLVLYPDIFSGAWGARAWRLFLLYVTVLRVFSGHRNILHHWYGTYIEIPFLVFAIIFRRRVKLLVHEITPLDYRSRIYKSFVECLFRVSWLNIEVMSQKNYEFFKMAGYTSARLRLVAHPVLRPPCFGAEEVVSPSLKEFFARWDNKVIVFFGDIRDSKGFRHFLALARLSRGHVGFAVCGQDIFGIAAAAQIEPGDDMLLSLKRQNDAELNFIFGNCLAISLLYEEMSQSGIYQLAAGFGTTVLLSDAFANEAVCSARCKIVYSSGCFDATALNEVGIPGSHAHFNPEGGEHQS